MAKFLSKINSPDYKAGQLVKIDSNKDLIPSKVFIDDTSGSLIWNNETIQQKILVTDDNNANTNVFNFQQSTDSGNTFKDLMIIKDNGEVIANKFTGTFNGNANSASTAKVTQTSPTTVTNYNLIFTDATATGNANLRIDNTDARISIAEGTTTARGFEILSLGNNIKDGTNGNKYGVLKLFSAGAGTDNIIGHKHDDNLNHTLPVTSGILLNSTNYQNYALPKAGGTITGNLVVNGTIEGKTTITADTDLITKSGIVKLIDKALIKYNSTDECIEFVFP